MSWTKTVTLWCDCGQWTTGDGLATQVHDARNYARKREGWKFVGGKDICPDCMDQAREHGV